MSTLNVEESPTMQEAIDKLNEMLEVAKEEHTVARGDLNVAKNIFDGAQKRVVSIEITIAGYNNSIDILEKETGDKDG